MIEKTTGLYEILYRFKDGQLVGAHQIDLTVIRDTVTGEVFSSVEGAAQPIDQLAASALIGEQTVGLMAQIAALNAMVAAQAEAQASVTPVMNFGVINTTDTKGQGDVSSE